MTERVLFVDDDTNLLNGFRRQLRGRVDLNTAEDGHRGLAILKENGPYAVIISDLRMPGMDGIEFLSAAKVVAPDSIRFLLTGNADLEVAIEAVNRGNIFRLLLKPCPTDNLVDAIQAGIQQYRLVTAERVLLEKTLSGSIRVLTETLGLINPPAFSSAARLKRYVGHMARNLELSDVWEFELAAMLSQIGCITLHPDLISKAYGGGTLTKDEIKKFSKHPQIGGDLLVNIPRLELISAMIRAQRDSSIKKTSSADLLKEGRKALGGHLIKVALHFDMLRARRIPSKVALARLLRHGQEYVPEVVDALKGIDSETSPPEMKEVSLEELNAQMTINKDILTNDGLVLASRGQEVTLPLLERLRSFAETSGVNEPIQVIVQSTGGAVPKVAGE